MSESQGDFRGKQFSKEEVAEKVLEQYDDEKTRIFYQCVMGGGGHDIHFGLFREKGWGVLESSAATTDHMVSCMDWAKKVNKDSVVLDLGSGHGGGTHALVQKFGCSVECFNLGPQQNDMNMEECKRLGIADRVNCHVGNLNDPLPAEWTEKFDYVWSSEVLCHAGDKDALFKEMKRVLKPGGIMVFSDIMGADDADEVALKGFTDRNATSYMGRPKMYIDFIKGAGLKYMCWWDNSHHLETYFRQMLAQIANGTEEMMSKGLTAEYLQNWTNSLTERADIQGEKNVFAWGVFLCRKEGGETY